MAKNNINNVTPVTDNSTEDDVFKGLKKAKNNFTPEFERKILGFNIKNYVDVFREKHGIENDYKYFFISPRTYDMTKTALEHDRELELWSLSKQIEKEINEGILDARTILQKHYDSAFYDLSEDDLKTVYTLRKGAFRDDEAKKGFAVVISRHLQTIYTIQLVHEMLKELDSNSEPETTTEKRVKRSNKKRVMLLLDLGILEALEAKGIVKDTKKAIVIRELLGLEGSPSDTATNIRDWVKSENSGSTEFRKQNQIFFDSL